MKALLSNGKVIDLPNVAPTPEIILDVDSRTAYVLTDVSSGFNYQAVPYLVIDSTNDKNLYNVDGEKVE
jgi:hypothetical protein